MLFTYVAIYRPPSAFTVPKGWTLVERGTGGFFPLREDLPTGETTFGVIGYERELTRDECERFDLERR